MFLACDEPILVNVTPLALTRTFCLIVRPSIRPCVSVRATRKPPQTRNDDGQEVPDGEGTSTLYCARAQKKTERLRELQSKHDQVKMERMNKFQGVNVYVKNLDEGVTEDALREAFAPHGTITSARVMVDNSNNNQSKGFGFVCFSAPEEATKAITEMNGKMLLNKPIYVALAQRREVRRTQLEAQFAQRTGGMPPRGMPMPGGGAQNMYNMPYWMGAQPGMPQQPRQYMMPQMMPRGPRGPMPAFGGRGNYPMPAYATAGQVSFGSFPWFFPLLDFLSDLSRGFLYFEKQGDGGARFCPPARFKGKVVCVSVFTAGLLVAA